MSIWIKETKKKQKQINFNCAAYPVAIGYVNYRETIVCFCLLVVITIKLLDPGIYFDNYYRWLIQLFIGKTKKKTNESK